jgi:hypothetical protein
LGEDTQQKSCHLLFLRRSHLDKKARYPTATLPFLVNSWTANVNRRNKLFKEPIFENFLNHPCFSVVVIMDISVPINDLGFFDLPTPMSCSLWVPLALEHANTRVLYLIYALTPIFFSCKTSVFYAKAFQYKPVSSALQIYSSDRS